MTSHLTVYEIIDTEWSGRSQEVDPLRGWPADWTPEVPPPFGEGYAAYFSGGRWHAALQRPPSIEPARAAKRAEADAVHAARASTPFVWDFGETEALDDLGASVGPAGERSLQIRHLEDHANWTAVHATALAAVVGGQTETPTPLKTADNLWVQTTAAQVVAVLTVGVEGRPGLLARQSLILARYGALKRQIADAADLAALEAIDLAAGWPG